MNSCSTAASSAGVAVTYLYHSRDTLLSTTADGEAEAEDDDGDAGETAMETYRKRFVKQPTKML